MMMKKELIIVILSVMLSVNGFAQGITFFKGSYQEALTKASAENKMVFVDFFTEWCGPCKTMAKEVFTDKLVGEYYNDKFIAIQLNAEDPANKAVVKQFKINVYPTLAYVKSNGKIALIKTGFQTIEEFLKIGRIASGDELGFEDLYAKYKSSKGDLTVLQLLLKEAPAFVQAQEGIEAEKWQVRVMKLYREYIKRKMGPDLINKEDYIIIQTYQDNTLLDDPLVEFINQNLAAFRKELGDGPAYYVIEHNDHVMEKLAKDGNEEYKKYLERINGDLKEAYDVVPDKSVSPYEKSKCYYDAIYTLYYKKDVNEYIKLMGQYMEILGKSVTANDYGEAAQNIYMAISGKLPKEVHEQAIKWLQGALQFKDVALMDKVNYLTMLGDSYKLSEDYAKAKECYNQALILSYQIDMQMTQLMLKHAIESKLSELELLQK